MFEEVAFATRVDKGTRTLTLIKQWILSPHRLPIPTYPQNARLSEPSFSLS